jgi:hypothetical protein
MTKLDLRQQFKHLYTAPKNKILVVDVPKFKFLMIDGRGDPNTSKEFQEGISALYSVAYTLKFMFKLKRKPAIDFPVMALEGLWWAEGIELFSLAELHQRKEEWKWTLMIMQPEVVTSEWVAKAINEARRKKSLPALNKVRLESFHEGLCAQLLHIGPYSAEQPNIERLHNFIRDGGHALRGKHHEIYLGDPRRRKPERLKTMIRQPMK